MTEKVIIGNVELWHGDCREILPELPMFDLILTDPPYGLSEAAGKNKSRKSRTKLILPKDYGNKDWDNKKIEQSLINKIIDQSKYMIMFGGNYYSMPPTSCILVWDKDNGKNDFADCELAWTNIKKAVRIKRYRWNGMLQQDMKNKEYRYHPTQKPVVVMEWCITQVPVEIKTICDPFMGSGTTGVAAMNHGKQFVGIEQDREYFDIACERIQQAQSQTRLFT